jgi:hypothetical protein
MADKKRLQSLPWKRVERAGRVKEISHIGGPPPFGYQAVDGRLIPVDWEQRAIGKALEGEGFRPGSGAEWQPTTRDRSS